jgi:uncharacterized protein
MRTVLIAGGTGLVGTRLSEILRSRGYKVLHLSRKQNLEAEFPAYAWNVEKGTIDDTALTQADYIINLAGAGIADKRWSASRKKLIIESRTQSTALLGRYIKEKSLKIKAYLSASAIGYYGDRNDDIMTEESLAGNGFLVESTVKWEKYVNDISVLNIRTIVLRIGVVLTTKGGALEKMLISFWFRMAVYFGNGKQWFSWIHIEDVCNMFVWAIENEKIQGTYNAVAPVALTNYDLTEAISIAKGGGYMMMPTPAFALRLAMGEMADVVLNSTRVSSQKVENQGFRFQFREIIPALRDLFK